MTNLKNNKRKGFTLVELLVVIAILAILATVSIVGYTNFINKANEANDLSVAKQMNDALLASSVSGVPGNFNDVLTIAEDAGFVLENLNPTSDGYHYVWDKKQNKFFLVDIDESTNVATVVYPEGETMTSTSEGELWTTAKTTDEYKTLANIGYYVYGASTEIDYLEAYKSSTNSNSTAALDIYVSSSTVCVGNVDNESELTLVGAMVNSAKTGTTWEIHITNDITLTGEWAPLGKNKITHSNVNTDEPDNWFQGKIIGTKSGSTSSGDSISAVNENICSTIKNLNASTNGILDNAGLISTVAGTGATVKDLIIDGGTVSNPMDTAGAVIGCQYKGDVTIINVHVKNMTISGEQAGGIIGCGTWLETTSSALTIKYCSVDSNSKISGSYQVGGILGGVWYFSTLTITGCTNAASVTSSGVSPQNRGNHYGAKVGGIVGCVGSGNASRSVTITSCSNSGAINGYTNSTVTSVSVGAIVGSGATVDNSNTNSGTVTKG